ncbi:MAG: amino acid ABC transporter permease [Allobranchiibius sp.]
MTETAKWQPSALQRERDSYRETRRRRSYVIAGAATIVVLAIVVPAITTSAGWPALSETYFSWSKAKSSFLPVLRGLVVNVEIMVICGLLIAVLSTFLAVLRTLRGPVFLPLRFAVTVYTDIFRGLPQILVILLLGLGMPGLQLQGLPTSGFFWGGLALVLSYSAYVSEVLRAGIESVHPSQRLAARALGLSHSKTMQSVVLPQGIRRVLPALMNDLISLQKDTSLLFVIGTVTDALLAANIEEAKDFNFTPYVVAGALFLLLTIPMTRLTDWYARKQGFQGVGGLV